MPKKNIAIFVLVLVLSSVFFALYSSQKQHPVEKTDRFVYEDFIKNHPDFLTTQKNLLKKQQYREFGEYSEKIITEQGQKLPYFEVRYLQYVAIRAYINAVRVDQSDTDSLQKSLRISAEILADEEAHYIRVYTVDLVDRFFYTSIRPEIRSVVMQDSYFSQFKDPKEPANVNKFRKNLLTFGDTLYPMTNIQMKLALLAVHEMQAIQKQTTLDNKSLLLEAKKKEILALSKKAEATLQTDYTGKTAPFLQRGYIAESLITKATLAERYFETTREEPFGKVEDLYQVAIEESTNYSPSFTNIAKKQQSAYLVKKDKTN